MKVCVISTAVLKCPPRGYAGIEQITWELARGLAARGHQVSLVAPDGSTCPGVEIIATGAEGQWNEEPVFGTYWPRLRGFDVIIDHSWQKWSYMLKAEGNLPAPVLGVLHSTLPQTMASLPPGVAKPCIVAISEDQASHFEALLGYRPRVACNGVDVEFYRPMSLKRSSRFLFVARFSAIKGADLAIEACKQAGVGLDLIGDVELTGEPAYVAQCRAMADGDQIRIIGPQSRAECVWWMSQAHAFIHPNQRFREPFGLAPVEAMACGLPVIAWRHGAVKETIADRVAMNYRTEAGVLVNDLDHMVREIKGYAAIGYVTEEMRQACVNRAQRFSMPCMIDRYEQLCTEALAGGW